jgi:RHS repeat-associated protein
LSYDVNTNRITTAGYSYDAAGNQARALASGNGATQHFQYDAANRLVRVTDDNAILIASYTYGASNQRLITDENGTRTYYAAEGGAVIAEYLEADNSSTMAWSKSYVYLGNRLLATLTPNNSGGEAMQFHHPDRLGTRLVTNPADGSFFEQQTLPFGTALDESAPSGGTTNSTNRRFTTYDRSGTTHLDYAVNRHYDSLQGRFTQVDPAGMGMVSLESPQTLNLYAYCANDPINTLDPSGLGFLSFLKKLFVIVVIAVAIIAAVAFTFAAVAADGTPLASLASFLWNNIVGPAISIAQAGGLVPAGPVLGPGGTAVWNGGVPSGLIERSSTIDRLIINNWSHSETRKIHGLGTILNPFGLTFPGPALYRTLDEAAIAALRAINPRSKRQNVEYAGQICHNSQGYFYTAPAKGTIDSSDPSESPCPKGSSTVAEYHTHGAYLPKYDNEMFSLEDVEGVHVPQYVATPTGRIRVYDPAVGVRDPTHRSTRTLKARTR